MAGEAGPASDPLAPAPPPLPVAAGGAPLAPPPTPAGPPLARARAAALSQLIERLGREPYTYDFFQILRRIEAIYRDRPERPRLGAALRPADEPIRLGQDPSLSFAPSALSVLRAGKNGAPPLLAVHFFGLMGPNGPLPMHLTEYVRDRMRNALDPTMSRFLDLFHHRMLMFFYRAWASARATVSADSPETNRFLAYDGALSGRGTATLRNRDEFPDPAKLYYTGLLAAQTRNAEGLQSIIGDFFKMPAEILPFVGDWMELPLPFRWQLGRDTGVGRLGRSTTLGAHVWGRQQKFRIVMGPLNRAQFQRLLPGGESLPKLKALVRNYIGDELRWDLQLFLQERVEEPMKVGQSRLGWTAWLGRATERGRREDLILDPQMETYRAA
jgi:type VI secretion system protein ImpH